MTVKVLPVAHRASWAQVQTEHDAEPTSSSDCTPAPLAVRPLILAVSRAIETDVERLHTSVEAWARAMELDNLNEDERKILRESAKLVHRVIGGP